MEDAFLFYVAIARRRTLPRRVVATTQWKSGTANPPDTSGRDPQHESEVRDVLGDYRACADHRPSPDRHRGDADSAGTN
jgi:hypothetical protein